MDRWLVYAASALIGCSRAEVSGGPASRGELAGGPSVDAACGTRVAEKLGVPFVRVCEGPMGDASRSFWISAVPMGCSAGDHDTLRCPPVVAIAEPRADDPPSSLESKARVAAVVEADIAHRVCTMRFAGRLPTSAERTVARASLGLATVVVSESRESTGVRLRELAEWVTRESCDVPSILGAECGVRRFPWDASPNVAWDLVVRCEATRSASIVGRPWIDLDGACPAPSAASVDGGQGALRDVSCAVRSPAEPRAPRAGGVLLACAGPTRAPAHAAIAADVAAFRCVLPEWR